MADPIYSPDGNMLWTGTEWISAPPISQPIHQTNPAQMKVLIPPKIRLLLGVGLILVVSIIILQSQENEPVGTVDLYITYGVSCDDCGAVSADLTLIDGSQTTRYGIPDEDGLVLWEYKYVIKEDALYESHFAYIIAEHSADEGDVFGTFIFVDDVPIGSARILHDGANVCMVDGNWVYDGHTLGGSGDYFSYGGLVNRC